MNLNNLLSFKTKLIIFSAYTLFIVLSTLYVHNKFINSDKLKETENKLEKAQEVPTKIIDFNQNIRKTNVTKDSCFNANIPTDALKLLRN